MNGIPKLAFSPCEWTATKIIVMLSGWMNPRKTATTRAVCAMSQLAESCLHLLFISVNAFVHRYSAFTVDCNHVGVAPVVDH